METTTTTENGQATKRKSVSYKTELNKSKRREYVTKVIAIAGWSLALVLIVVFFIVR